MNLITIVIVVLRLDDDKIYEIQRVDQALVLAMAKMLNFLTLLILDLKVIIDNTT